MTINTNYSANLPSPNPDYNSYVDRKAGEGDSIMSQGMSVLFKFMTLFSDIAQGKYDQMSAKADRARDSQQMANKVDSIISQITDAGSKKPLPQDVIDYLKAHNIQLTVQNNGQSSTGDIESYLAQIQKDTGSRELNKGQLDVIKGALDADSGRCTDFVSQAQLQIQKVMQSYNVTVSLINSMQTMLAEMNKSIAQNIR